MPVSVFQMRFKTVLHEYFVQVNVVRAYLTILYMLLYFNHKCTPAGSSQRSFIIRHSNMCDHLQYVAHVETTVCTTTTITTVPFWLVFLQLVVLSAYGETAIPKDLAINLNMYVCRL